MARHENDLAAEMELGAYDAESCPSGHHPSTVGLLTPTWVSCDLCRQVEALQKAGPPGPGNHIALVTHEEAARRLQLRADLLADD